MGEKLHLLVSNLTCKARAASYHRGNNIKVEDHTGLGGNHF